MALWDQAYHSIKEDYPDVTSDKMLVEAMIVRMILKPEFLDTIGATNLRADILPELAVTLSGSISIAPSSNLDPSGENPSMFEPIHGSAPDIAGKGIANPEGAVWSVVELVKWFGEETAAEYLMRTVEDVTKGGVRNERFGW